MTRHNIALPVLMSAAVLAGFVWLGVSIGENQPTPPEPPTSGAHYSGPDTGTAERIHAAAGLPDTTEAPSDLSFLSLQDRRLLAIALQRCRQQLRLDLVEDAVRGGTDREAILSLYRLDVENVRLGVPPRGRSYFDDPEEP